MENIKGERMESRKIRLEKKTIEKMIGIYCRKKHNNNNFLCYDCSSMKNYAVQRLAYCPFGGDKPVCSDCTVHCYKKDYREKVKEIMRFSGPRMIFKHPYLAITHLYYQRKYKNSKIREEKNEEYFK